MPDQSITTVVNVEAQGQPIAPKVEVKPQPLPHVTEGKLPKFTENQPTQPYYKGNS